MNVVTPRTKLAASKVTLVEEGQDPTIALYLAGRREWDERYGSLKRQARMGWIVAAGMAGLAAISVLGMVRASGQNHVIPYVVQTDHLGDALAVKRADVVAPADPRIIRSQLARWVFDVRTVYADRQAQDRLIKGAFALTDRGQAGQKLKNWYVAHAPYGRARKEHVAVAVQSVLPLSGHTWRVEWKETTRELTRDETASREWQAVLTVKLRTPTSAAAVLANPIGLFVTRFDWSPQI